ncbi:MAG: hypothetical protein WEC33_00065 [Dehalococcoidia bacterium]
MPGTNMFVCQRCKVLYDWRRSTSTSLKMTYCGSLCEAGDLGFTIDGLVRDWHPAPARAAAELTAPAAV